MNVGILTVNGFNCGSFLQGFALKRFIEKMDYKVYVINTMELQTFIRRIGLTNPSFGFKKVFNCLSAWKKLNMSSHLRHYDIVIVGSDVVWAKHKPDILFGHKIKADKTIAYAPCCGDTTYDELNSLQIKDIKSMDILSARDENTAEMVKQVTGKKPPIVLDPTFIIDWKKYEIPTDRENYILVYSYTGKPKKLRIAALELSRKTGKKIISVRNYISWCDTSIPVSPFEFLGFVKNADYVITDTFHGTIFSLIYRKTFASFPTSRKVKLLLDSFGMEYNTLISDYSKVDLQPKIEESMKYLKEALKE